MDQSLNKDKVIALYTHLMDLAQTSMDADGTDDMIEASLELLDLSITALGLSFRWNEEIARWVLEPMSEQEQAALIDALTDFAKYEQKGKLEQNPIQVPECAIQGCTRDSMFKCECCRQSVCLLHVVSLAKCSAYGENIPLLGCVACVSWNEHGARDVYP